MPCVEYMKPKWGRPPRGNVLVGQRCRCSGLSVGQVRVIKGIGRRIRENSVT